MPTVLIVEDHALMSQMLSRLLRERAQMEVWAVVETAEAALAALAAGSDGAGARALPDIALIDVSLPGMSGIALLAELCDRYPDLPCLMVSAHQDQSYVKRAMANGARGYVPKGDAFALLEAVRRVLGGEERVAGES